MQSSGARNLRKDVLGTFLTSYKLKTMPTGAVVREWPMGFSVWNEDESAPDGSGYRLLETFKNDPARDLVNDLYDVRNCRNCLSLKDRSALFYLSNLLRIDFVQSNFILVYTTAQLP